MKNLKRLLTLSLLLITIMACSSDDSSTTEDNQANIIGTWKLSSSSTNGVVDSLDACDLQTTLEIASSQIDITEYWGDNCVESDTYSISYTVSGKNLTISESGFSYTSEITTLTSTTLSIKDVDEGDVYIETYTRK
ncbi:lipocalin family protein [Thalassobellus suaedae]|uniref:Lipocalin family protein n=1 Tax=Thalassobellus suaedae TaxID=3074124 RepID=A0ABY9XQS6_9FLAO|nr:lipocalin family protein [Flavobacteriaceae bacterium HL-DH14]